MVGNSIAGAVRRHMKTTIFAKWLLAVPCALFWCVPVASGRSAVPSDEWAAYGQGPGNMRYSPLKQITPVNVHDLAPVWTFHMRPASLDVPAANRSAATPRSEERRVGKEG